MPLLVNKVRSAEGLDCELCGGTTTVLHRAYIAGGRGKPGRTMQVCPTCNKYRTIFERYGIAVDQYRRVEKRQAGRCAACHEETGKFWIDKHEGIGEGFSLLCPKCKMVVGNVKNDRERISNVFDYIDRFH